MRRFRDRGGSAVSASRSARGAPGSPGRRRRVGRAGAGRSRCTASLADRRGRRSWAAQLVLAVPHGAAALGHGVGDVAADVAWPCCRR